MSYGAKAGVGRAPSLTVRFDERPDTIIPISPQSPAGRILTSCHATTSVGASRSLALSHTSLAFDRADSLPLDLYTAASIGAVDEIKQLISRAVDVDRRNRSEWTALMYAASLGHRDACRLLLDSGARPNLGSGRGQTALMLAAACGHDAVLQLLCDVRRPVCSANAASVQRGAHCSQTDARGWSALHQAVTCNHLSATRILLCAGADSSHAANRHVFSPFLQACADGYQQLVQLMLDHGADATQRSPAGEDALQVAQLYNQAAIVKLLSDGALVRTGKSSKRSTSGCSLPSVASGSQLVHEAFDGAALYQQHCKLESHAFPADAGYPCDEEVDFPSSLSELLSRLGLAQYTVNFTEHDVDLRTFLGLNDAELREIGISKLGPRKKMLRTIESWHSKGRGDDHATIVFLKGREAELQDKVEAGAAESRRVQQEVLAVAAELKASKATANGFRVALGVCDAAARDSRQAAVKALRLLREPSSSCDVRRELEHALRIISDNCNAQSLKVAATGIY